MKPLSRNKRRIYLAIACIVFIFIVPVLILYATGYRFQELFTLTEVGGLYITAPSSNTDIFINDELIKRTGVFQKNVFIQDLKPGSYDIKVVKQNSQSWSKKLNVFPKTVTEAHSFILPLDIALTEIPYFAFTERSTSASRKNKENSDYKKIAVLFDTPTDRVPESTENLKTKRDINVENIEGVLHVTWSGDEDSIPYFFCESEVCKKEIIIKISKIEAFDFFPERNDLLIVKVSDGIYVVEIDERSSQNVQTLTLGTNLDFRVKNNENIYIKKDGKIYSISL